MSEGLAREVAEEFVVAELAGVKTHGIGKLVSLNLGDLNAAPKIQEHGALLSIDGCRGNGFKLFREIAGMLIERCPRNGISAAFVHNFSRYSSLYPYTSRVAKAGYATLLANSAGPAAVTPFGSVDPLTGTNPICFSFPKPKGQVQTFDFATSEVVWGAIRQAAIEGKALPTGPFLDAAGDVTTIPSEVNAVRGFGGRKGFALNLAIEILAGILPGGRAGMECESEFDCGAFFIAIDPKFAGAGAEGFAQGLERLLVAVRGSRPEDPSVPVRAPGDRGRNSISLDRDHERKILVPDTVIEMMRRMAAGESVAELASNPLFN
ncbi:putative oxidoreductase YbiC [Terricaulis silvestris]|uniref:Putative oxidoreductase YbiC n=2 Tax=Terricaulis silvestris TaxID=2686094 RepID=A0A6I6MW38_9CAUL|nr:putative oxidoreductase YbiC [Terricaulis silvestris]